MTDDVLKNLVEGYQSFRHDHIENSSLYNNLITEGQSPKTLIIACCDSRVDPAIVVNAKPGDLFVVRNIANLVPPYPHTPSPEHQSTRAAIEFAIKGLNVEHIIVMGHSHCGGIRALMESTPNNPSYDFIESWMKIGETAKQQTLKIHPNATLDDQSAECEKTSLLLSLKNLQTYPWLQSRVDNNKLQIHAWYFDFATQAVEAYHSESDSFLPLDSA